MIIKLNLLLPTEAQKTYFNNGIPLTKADFYYKQSKNEIYVFVDGFTHTPDYVQNGDKKKGIFLNLSVFQ